MLCESCGSPIDESGDAFSSTVKVGKVLYCGPPCADLAKPPLFGADVFLELLDSPPEAPVRWQSAGTDAPVLPSPQPPVHPGHRWALSSAALIRILGSTD